MTLSGRTSENGLKSMKIISLISFTIGSLRGSCDGEDGDKGGELIALGESGGEALCDRGGEGGLEKGRYGVSRVLDKAYWGFLGVGTTFDIFQNILFPYGLNTAYWIFLDTAYSILFPLWYLVKCRHGYTVSSLMDTAYWLSE
ncbi:hypothetical protein Tco_0394050 [Tanacetum coccineum]